MARKKRSREELEAILSEPKTQWETVHEVLGALPEDIDPVLAAKAALSLMDRTAYWFARRCKALPAPVVAEVLRRLEAEPRTAVNVFLLEAMRQPKARWEDAIGALGAFQTSSKERQQRLRALTKSPLLSAVQAAVSFGTEPSWGMQVTLAMDGSESSVDALLPHFTRAVADRSNALDALQRLKKDATRTPEMVALFAKVDALLTERNDTSPALAFARRLGFEVETFDVSCRVSSVQLNRSNVPSYQGECSLDSTSATWFRVWVSKVPGGSTHFGSGESVQDALGLGTCTPEELPAWYARAAKRLKIDWDWDDAKPRGLRGKKQQQFHAWLRGGTP